MRHLVVFAVLLAPLGALAKPKAIPILQSSEVIDSSFASRPLAMMAVLAAMAIIPFAILMLTSFSKVAVVLSIARSAMGTQQIPPTTVLTGLAVILSVHVMAPVFEEMWRAGKSAISQAHDTEEALAAATMAAAPLKDFLLKHGHAEDRALFFDLARELRGEERADEVEAEDLVVAVPAFMVSELKEAFQIGFLVFLPFLVLDMVIANLLLALGMQSLSPTSVSLPFKLLLFVMVDGWTLLSQGLVLGYR
ncbi:MAG: type III secretion system export apparatus subunit SctR [Myxococcales bacterium]|jgi:type III secretion protein R